MTLNPRQQRFVDEYLVDLNATQAAIRAGYAEGSASVTGARLLAHDKIRAVLAKRQRKHAVKAEVTVQRIVDEMAAMAFYDPADLAGEPMAGPADIAKLPEQVRRAIVGWGWDKAGNFVLKLAPKQTALDQLAKHLGMFVDRHEHSGPGGGPIMLTETERAARVATLLQSAVKRKESTG